MESLSNSVVIIGPALPFRGGIAQHTTMLKRALAEKSDVLMISFSRQYPAFIYPGESDYDPSYKGHKESQTEYIIDSLNPLSWKRAINKVIEVNPQTILIPWWTIFWAPCFGYITWALKKRGVNIVFFCHNVIEHETAAWKRFVTKNIFKNASRFIVHTKEDEKNLKDFLPDAIVTVHPHPIYDHFPKPKGEFKRRRALELLFYGFVRPYKGLEDLIEAMGVLKGQDIQLTIAGEFWNGEQEIREKIESLGLSEQIELRPRYHTDQETAELFDRADVVTLPYRSATGSGVVPIAYHYNKPVIVTHVGGLPDVVIDGQTGFIIPPKDITLLVEAINKFRQQPEKNWSIFIQKYKKKFSWVSLAKSVVEQKN